MQERYDAFIHAIDSGAELPRDEREARWRKMYDRLFPGQGFNQLHALGDQEVDLAFWAAANAVRLIEHPRHVREARLAFDELHARQVATTRHYTYMQGAYIQMRMLEEARRFHSQHTSIGLDPVPVVHEPVPTNPGSPTQLVVDPDGQALVRRSVDISGPSQIVVVAHPRCHFSRDAMLAIEADPILSTAFGQAKWLMPPDFRFDMEAVQQWNRSHPAITLAHAYKTDEWPQLDYWGTPTFYFFRDGVLETKVTGWPKGGRRDELLAALREVGMLPVEE